MKVVNQWIIENRLIVKTEDQKYYYDEGRGHYNEITKEKAEQKIIKQ
ncbi:hypothetical protein [Tenacibaculum ovolyticum]|nr:hypothetical protein [Tenacibaculum ovolyticum]